MSEKKTQKSDTKRQTKKILIQSLSNNLGIVSIACKHADISRDTFYRWKKEDKKFGKGVEEVLELQKGEVEDFLLEAIRKRSIQAIMFYLRNKHEAYHPRQTIGFDHTEGDSKLDKIAETLK